MSCAHGLFPPCSPYLPQPSAVHWEHTNQTLPLSHPHALRQVQPNCWILPRCASVFVLYILISVLSSYYGNIPSQLLVAVPQCSYYIYPSVFVLYPSVFAVRIMVIPHPNCWLLCLSVRIVPSQLCLSVRIVVINCNTPSQLLDTVPQCSYCGNSPSQLLDNAKLSLSVHVCMW